MIRIADILKNVGHNDDSEVKREEIRIPKSEFSAEETQKFCSGIIKLLKGVTEKKEVDESAIQISSSILSGIEKLVEQQMANKTSIMDNFMDRAECEEKVYVHAIKIVIVAVRMGIDVMYSGKKLQELALAALLSDLDASNVDIRVFEEILSANLKVNIVIPEFESIIRLAQIYKI